MIDAAGEEWLTPMEAAVRFGVDRSLIYVWLHRSTPPIRNVKAGRLVAVNMVDVARAEHAWRTRAKGHQKKRRAEVVKGEHLV